MNYRFENGAIVAYGKLCEEAVYDVSNNRFGATFNGRGAAIRYMRANKETINLDFHNFVNICYNGVIQDVLLDKEVYMKGRSQTVKIDLKTAVLEIELFLTKQENGIFMTHRLITENKHDTVEIRLTGYVSKQAGRVDSRTVAEGEAIFRADRDILFIKENSAIGFTLDCENPQINMIYAYEESITDIETNLKNFITLKAALKEEMDNIKLPSNLDEREKALFYSAYYCALQNFKDFGEYKGFMAGCNYLYPIRTYYRDSYFTVLSMYNGNLDKVRAQICTLARGIGKDGTCPSAVKSDWSAWWGDHFDSPSFLAMMLFDYIKFTGDIAFADTVVDESTVFEKAVKAIGALSKRADKTGLLYKEGIYNKRDWADEVNRYGYVTYDEILYARALYSIA
ncbi:MAG: hypothetical protein ACOYJS_04615, partial [Acutalibacteraceae bacterium]